MDRSDVVLVGRRQRRVRPLVGRAVELGIDRGQRGVVVPAQAVLVAQELAYEHGAVDAAVGPQHDPPVDADQVLHPTHDPVALPGPQGLAERQSVCEVVAGKGLSLP